MVRLEKTDGTCFVFVMLNVSVTVSSFTILPPAISCSSLSNTSRATETAALTRSSQIWTCGTVITQWQLLLSKSLHTSLSFYRSNRFKAYKCWLQCWPPNHCQHLDFLSGIQTGLVLCSLTAVAKNLPCQPKLCGLDWEQKHHLPVPQPDNGTRENQHKDDDKQWWG